MQLNPARERKQLGIAEQQLADGERFMQLNPARGRKLEDPESHDIRLIEVYAAQPREGTETEYD